MQGTDMQTVPRQARDSHLPTVNPPEHKERRVGHRVGWDALSTSQRRRYERAGITGADYSAGVPLAAARGHAATPERPARAEATPDRYRSYLGKRRAPMRAVTTEGVQPLLGLSKAEARIVAQHENAVKHYLNSGDTTSLDTFQGVQVAGQELETRTNSLDWLAITGDVRFESIYVEVA
jgi:hypothetical protein